MAKELDPRVEEIEFLGLTRAVIDDELALDTDGSGAADKSAARELSRGFEVRRDAFRNARERPFDGTFELFFDGSYQVFHFGKQNIDVEGDLVLHFMAPLTAERFSANVSERRVIRYKEDEIVDVLVDGNRRGAGLKSLSNFVPKVSSSSLQDPTIAAVPRVKRNLRSRSMKPLRKKRIETIEMSTEDQTAYSGFIDVVLTSMADTRGAKMTEIVATIQRDQDLLMRQPRSKALAVQGGPGTGKTVVGLHRLAFVAYEARERKVGSQLLMLGPSDRFVHYVRDVLPSLGENNIDQLSFASLCLGSLTPVQQSQVEVTLIETAEVAHIKASIAIFALMRRLLVGRLRSVDIHIRLGTNDVYVEAAKMRNLLVTGAAQLIAGNVTMASIRDSLVLWLSNHVRVDASFAVQNERLAVNERMRERHEGAQKQGAPLELIRSKQLSHDEKAVVRAAKEVATKLVPEDDPLLLLAQFHDEKSNVFDSEEPDFAPNGFERLLRELILLHENSNRNKQRRSGAISASDLPLIHELKRAGGDPNLRPRDHVMVDEIQDFTPAMLQVVRYYFREQEVTLLGDFNQRTRPEAVKSWVEIQKLLELDHLSMSTLTNSYRVPKQTLELAAKVLSVDERSRTPQGVRSGAEPEFLKSAVKDLPDVVSKLIKRAKEGRILVIAQAATHASYAISDDWVTLVDPSEVNGLEAGLVIVVEPGKWRAPSDVLSNLLYVALTRTMSRLIVVHSGPLPDGLEVKKANNKTKSKPVGVPLKSAKRRRSILGRLNLKRK